MKVGRRQIAMILFFFTGVAFIYAYNRGAPLKSPVQLAFEKWLADYGKSPDHRLAVDASTPQTTSRLVSLQPALSVKWEVGAQGKNVPSARMARLLHLIEEANLFSAGRRPFSQGRPGQLRLSVVTEQHSFETDLQSADLEASPAAQVFAKLLEISTTEEPASAATPLKRRNRKGAVK